MKALVGGLAACLLASMSVLQVRAAIRYDELWLNPSIALDRSLVPEVANGRSVYDEMLVANGIDPSSDKGRLILTWIARINADSMVRGNAHRSSRLFLNPRTRAELISDGLERLSPDLRLQYVSLIAKFLDTLVPFDCFGLNNMSAVVDRISLSAMSEADIDAYFRVLLAALRASELETRIDIPSAQQYEDADESLRRSLLEQLGYLPANIARYVAYSQNPSAAAPVDACWGIRVTMHAILALPDPERDIVLRRTVRSQREAH
ncbi:hypothetical protein NK8_67190 (plasmid) [Caballeronia sp. NK8]|uniref:hypothetical protein n=1 Tax=Caballeronia sp. NK8 TaxID=140098 RepID=UPI001BB5F058|nr:hypothetical protein [Caballeronia sp. NK8]BCQ28529.1 hypothetical protein NK8_67190 [Caballeronia sp. NK8]